MPRPSWLLDRRTVLRGAGLALATAALARLSMTIVAIDLARMSNDDDVEDLNVLGSTWASRAARNPGLLVTLLATLSIVVATRTPLRCSSSSMRSVLRKPRSACFAAEYEDQLGIGTRLTSEPVATIVPLDRRRWGRAERTRFTVPRKVTSTPGQRPR